MNDLKIEWEWDDPKRARGKELRATWAQLTIHVGANCVTRHVNFESRGVRSGVFGPLYPIGEWLVHNWWALLNEPPNPERLSDGSYSWRHNLRFAGEGFALPSLLIGADAHFQWASWKPWTSRAAKTQFLGEGRVAVEHGAWVPELKRFIQAIVDRLRDQRVDGTPLQLEWEAILATNADVEETDFCNIAGLLGIDPYDLDPSDADRLIAAADAVPPEARSELFAASSFDKIDAILKWVGDAQSSFAGAPAMFPLLRKIAPGMPRPSYTSLPWEDGYRLAQAFRETIGLNGKAPVDLSDLCGQDPADAIHFLNAPSRIIDGWVRVDPSLGFDVCLGSSRTTTKRFAFCRALSEFLNSTNVGATVLSASENERQQRTRAFAAEVLAPAESLRKRIRSYVSQEESEELADDFNVSPWVIQHQIRNHRLADLEVAYRNYASTSNIDA